MEANQKEMILSPNFELQEFQSGDFAAFPEDVIENLKELSHNLEALRKHIGRPIIITSGYRSPSHNQRIGGAKKSYHIKGMAADIKVKDMSPKIVYNMIELLIKYGKMKEGGLGLYSGWVHYDTRGTKARWNH